MSEALKLILELLGFFVTTGLTVGAILWRLSAATTTFTLIGQQQAQEIREIKLAVDKMETAISLIAVQDVKLTAMMARMDATDKRNDERFARIEMTLDEYRRGEGFIRPRNERS